MWKALFPTESWSPNHYCTVISISFWFSPLNSHLSGLHCGIRAGDQCNNVRKRQCDSHSRQQEQPVQCSASSSKGQCSAQENTPHQWQMDQRTQRASQKGSPYMLCGPHKQGTSSAVAFRRKHKSGVPAGLRKMSSLFKLMNFTFLTWQKVQCWMTHSCRAITQEPSERQGCLLILDLMAGQDICCWSIKAIRTRKP